MNRNEFAVLLERYNKGLCTDQEKSFVEHWYAVTQNESRENLDESGLNDIEPVMWQQIQNRIRAGSPGSEITLHAPRRFSSFRWTAVAASVILLLGVFFMLRTKQIPFSVNESEHRVGWIKKVNTSSENLPVTLPDGSEVNLFPQSSIEYPEVPGSIRREVYLTGDAFFEVQKSKTKPFFVYSGKVVTKVLGTSFFVRAENKNKQVSVEVVTGRVAVFEKEGKNESSAAEVILTPNQKTVFLADENQFVTSLVDAPKPIIANNQNEKPVSFEFEEEPLRNVILRLGKSYGITIELEKQHLGDCPLTANLSNLPLYAQLDMICAATKSNYVLKGTTIIIGGIGCANIQ